MQWTRDTSEQQHSVTERCRSSLCDRVIPTLMIPNLQGHPIECHQLHCWFLLSMSNVPVIWFVSDVVPSASSSNNSHNRAPNPWVGRGSLAASSSSSNARISNYSSKSREMFSACGIGSSEEDTRAFETTLEKAFFRHCHLQFGWTSVRQLSEAQKGGYSGQ